MTTQEAIGKIHNEVMQKDAIHIAVCQVWSNEVLYPGQTLYLKDALTGEVERSPGSQGHGIVDPFLHNLIYPNEKFYMFLYPNTITSLRHEWVHPAFPAVEKPPEVIINDAKTAAKLWIMQFAESVGLSFDELIEAAKDKVECDEWYVFNHDEHGESFDMKFWDFYEILYGKVREDRKENFFSCSC